MLINEQHYWRQQRLQQSLTQTQPRQPQQHSLTNHKVRQCNMNKLDQEFFVWRRRRVRGGEAKGWSTLADPQASRTNLCSLCFLFERAARPPAAELATSSAVKKWKSSASNKERITSHLQLFRRPVERSQCTSAMAAWQQNPQFYE
jgi:hypothetical protein